MSNPEQSAKVAIAFSVLVLIAIILSHLALTDIYHGEADTELEWRVVQLGATVVVVSQLASLYALRRFLGAAHARKSGRR